MAQELLAAYVTSRPLPCPKCRTKLRHDGPGRWLCPGCGNRLRIGAEEGSPMARPPQVPVPAIAPRA
jgi:tRNA(Ile2) C34 agmatinyltransferase TiaS